MKAQPIIASIFALVASSTAIADRMGPNGDKFYEEAAHYENSCVPQEDCKAPYTREVLYSIESGINKVEGKVKSKLHRVADEQAQIWGDTILEGDYYSTGRTRIDSILAFYKMGHLIGYKIRYSEKAWYLGDCAFDGSKQSLKGCSVGRITEGSYVSADAKTFFSDEERYAEFSMSIH